MPPYPPFPLRSPNRKAYSQAQEDNRGNSSHSGLVLGFYVMPLTPATWKRRSVSRSSGPSLHARPWTVLCICTRQMRFLGRCEGCSSSLPVRRLPGSWCWAQARWGAISDSSSCQGRLGCLLSCFCFLKVVSQVVSKVTASASWEGLWEISWAASLLGGWGDEGWVGWQRYIRAGTAPRRPHPQTQTLCVPCQLCREANAAVHPSWKVDVGLSEPQAASNLQEEGGD